MNIQELKAQAYDCIAQVEFWQKRLQDTNALINQAVNTPKVAPTEDTQHNDTQV